MTFETKLLTLQSISQNPDESVLFFKSRLKRYTWGQPQDFLQLTYFTGKYFYRNRQGRTTGYISYYKDGYEIFINSRREFDNNSWCDYNVITSIVNGDRNDYFD